MFFDPEVLPAGPFDLLAVAAHPGAVEQTCGGTLIRMAEAGYRTAILELTAGEMASRGTVESRQLEALEAGRRLLVSFRGHLGFPDARLENGIAGRISLMAAVRRLKPRVVILPFWETRHPDHYRTAEIAYEACYLAGLSRLDSYSEAHRPHKILYASAYAAVPPSFVVDVSGQFERRLEALLCYRSQYDAADGAVGFPGPDEVRRRLTAIARYYGNLIGVEYGEPFVVKETLRVDDVVAMGVPTF